MSTQLPAHLLALFNSNPEITEVGKNVQNDAHAKIRYNGSKWKLLPVSGEELPVTTSHLDVIVVDINEHKSHTVYEKAYDPKGDPEAPVWSSDDGTPVPAEHENKVVSDYRRVAVLVADNVEGGVYELRISAGSITNFDRYNTTIRNHGIPLNALITRITFDTSFDYPKLVFAPSSYITEEQAEALKKAFTSGKNQVQAMIGKRKETLAIAAPVAQPAIAAPIVLPPQTTSAVAQIFVAPIEEAPKRTRAKKEAEPAVVIPPTVAAAVITQPVATSNDLDALLSNIMGK